MTESKMYLPIGTLRWDYFLITPGNRPRPSTPRENIAQHKSEQHQDGQEAGCGGKPVQGRRAVKPHGKYTDHQRLLCGNAGLSATL
jgi:hypothetical protein